MNQFIDALVVAIPAILAFLLFRFWMMQGFYRTENIHVTDAQSVFPKYAAEKARAVNATLGRLTAELEENNFQKLVIGLFDTKSFTLVKWKNDKLHNGIYPAGGTSPDLEFRYNDRDEQTSFAVQCSWTQALHEDQLQWTKDYQLLNYRRFEHTKNMPVFVIIGLGGASSLPDELFILPLDRIQSTQLNSRQLNAFRRKEALKPFQFSINAMMPV